MPRTISPWALGNQVSSTGRFEDVPAVSVQPGAPAIVVGDPSPQRNVKVTYKTCPAGQLFVECNGGIEPGLCPGQSCGDWDCASLSSSYELVGTGPTSWATDEMGDSDPCPVNTVAVAQCANGSVWIPKTCALFPHVANCPAAAGTNDAAGCQPVEQVAGPTIPIRTWADWRVGGGLKDSVGNSQSPSCWADGEAVPKDTSAKGLTAWLADNQALPFLGTNLSAPTNSGDYSAMATRLACPVGLSGATCTDETLNGDPYDPKATFELPMCQSNGTIDYEPSVDKAHTLRVDKDTGNTPTDLSAAIYNGSYGSCLCSPFQFDPSTTTWPNAFVSWAEPSLVIPPDRQHGNVGFVIPFHLAQKLTQGTVLRSMFQEPWCDSLSATECQSKSTQCDVALTPAGGETACGQATTTASAPAPTAVATNLFKPPNLPAEKCSTGGYESTTAGVVIKPTYVPDGVDQDNWARVFADKVGCVVDTICGALSKTRIDPLPATLLGLAGTIQYKLTNEQVTALSIGPPVGGVVPQIDWTWTYGLACNGRSQMQALARPYVSSFVDDVLLPFGEGAVYVPANPPSWRLTTLMAGKIHKPMTNMLQVQPPVWVSRRALLDKVSDSLQEGPVKKSDVTQLASPVPVQLASALNWAGAVYGPGWGTTYTSVVEPVIRYGISDAGQVWAQASNLYTGPAHTNAYIGVQPAPLLPGGGSGPTRVAIPNIYTVWENQTEAEERPILFHWSTYIEDPLFDAVLAAAKASPPVRTDSWTQSTQRLSRVAISTLPGQQRIFSRDAAAADPWAVAYDKTAPALACPATHPNCNEAVDPATRLVMSPHFRFLLGDISYAVRQYVTYAPDSFVNANVYRVHDDMLASPDRMADAEVRTATFLLDGGQLIACCLGVGATDAEAETDVLAQMKALKAALDTIQDTLGQSAMIGTRWPIPLDPDTAQSTPRKNMVVPTLPTPMDGGLERAEAVLLESLENLYSIMAGDWLQNPDSLFLKTKPTETKKFALRIYWLNMVVDTVGYQLDVFNPAQKPRAASKGDVAVVQAATPILYEMLKYPDTWDAPKAGLTCSIGDKTVPCSWIGEGRDGLVFQSPLGKKLLKYARAEKGYQVYGPAPAVYAANLPTGTHDQIWLTQNVYNAPRGDFAEQWCPLWDEKGGLPSARAVCTTTTGNAAPIYSDEERTLGYTTGKPPTVRFTCGICACLDPSTALNFNNAVWEWFKSHPGIDAPGESLIQQIVDGLKANHQDQSKSLCLLDQCALWLQQYAPDQSKSEWFSGAPASDVKHAGGTYNSSKNTCANIPTSINVCTNSVVLTQDVKGGGVTQGIPGISVTQSCSGGTSGTTYRCVKGQCVDGGGTLTVGECIGSGGPQGATCLPPRRGSGISTTTLIGIVVGSVLGTALVVGIVVGVLMHKKKQKKALSPTTSAPP
jgi:hypothetical protein